MSATWQATQHKSIFGFIQSWLVENEKRFPELCWDKGGWEWWAQSEIAEFFKRARFPGFKAIHREHPIYNEAKSATDFLLVTEAASTCIEMKCESLFHSAKQGRATMDHTFYQEVQDDIFKLQTKRKGEYAGMPAMVIAFCFSDEASGPMKMIADECEEFAVGDGSWKMRVFMKSV